MLPMTLQFIIVMIASAINDRLQRKLHYVEEENRILQEQLDALTGGRRSPSPATSVAASPPLASCSAQRNAPNVAT